VQLKLKVLLLQIDYNACSLFQYSEQHQ
jgi:hypothetical protein